MKNRIIKIAVLGGSVIGLSSALHICKTFKETAKTQEVQVDIICDKLSPNTTSDVAAGYWEPYALGETPKEKILQWADVTYKYLQSIISTEGDASNTGVFYCPGFLISQNAFEPMPFWKHIPIGFRTASKSEMTMFPAKYKNGHFFISVVAEGKLFLSYLEKKFKEENGCIIKQKIVNFKQVFELGYDIVVNCTGIGSYELCQDTKMYPIRGQVHRLKADWFKFFVVDNEADTYVLPNVNSLVCGGVCQKNNWNKNVNYEEKEDILKRVFELVPSISSSSILSDQVGLRPGRQRVRLEKEIMNSNNDKHNTIYHNYGHGGAGFTTFWGCAKEIAEFIVNDCILLNPSAKL